MIRFLGVATLALAMTLVAVRTLGVLFMTDGAPSLVALCVAAGACSLPIILSRLPDWGCWLLAQVFAGAGALWLANRPVGLTDSIKNLPAGGLTLALPGQPVSQAIALNIGGHGAIWMLLFLLGLLTWELTWGVLWLVLRAGYLWPAIVLAGANLLTAASVTNTAQSWLPPFVVLALLLVLWHTWSDRWAGAAAHAENRVPFRWASVSLAGGLCALAVALPVAWTTAPAWRTGAIQHWASQTWTRWQPRISNPLHLSVPPDSGALGAGGFGDRVALDGPFHPYPGLVMRVQGAPAGLQPYWRGEVYSQYSQGSWRLGDPGQTLIAPPGVPLPANVPHHGSRMVIVHITVAAPADGLLFAPGRPVAASVAVRGVYPDPNVSGSDPAAVYATSGFLSGVRYTIAAELPFSTPRPDAIGPPPDTRYIALPPGLDPRLRQLALRLTANEPDELGKARAITEYLRGSLFTYDSGIGAPPDGQDPLVYFLFTSHRGYCVHFASAMALLSRLAGLPARVVGGYITGVSTPSGWVVRGQDAHTWPEVFFQGVGWVPFEPTPGFIDALAPGQSGPGATALAGGTQPITKPARTTLPATPKPATAKTGRGRVSGGHGSPRWPPIILLAALLLGAGWAVSRRGPRTIGGLYRQLRRNAALLARAPRSWQTPQEFAHLYAQQSPEEYADVMRITSLYAISTYGQARVAPSPDEVRSAAEALRRLRRRWLARKLRLRRD
ncbi:MAG TPA: transglutaminase domain-containing protein [Chloroflexota bacterium]|nr:transglutaminase domain-containing protein [Chloroflexota bacterium]